jgi:hypothetical protein
VPLVGFPGGYVKKSQQIDLTGTLEWVNGGPDPKWVYTHFTGYRILVNGTSYQLYDVSGKAEKLLGQRVRVKGVLNIVESGVGMRSNNGEPVPAIARLFRDHNVIVTEIAATDGEYVHEVVTVELRGKLEMHTWPGYPKLGDVAMITVNGKGYVLRFENFPALEKFAAKYDGKTIVVRGTHAQKMRFPMMCKGEIEVPSFSVNEIEVVDGGVVRKATVIGVTGRIQGLPTCPMDAFVAKDGKVYDLDFGNRDDLRKKAAANQGKVFYVVGVVISNGDVMPTLSLLHVSDVQPVSDGTVQLTQKWEVRGKLLQVHAAPKSMGYVGLWCMVEVNGTCYWLDFGWYLPMQKEGDLEQVARKLVGQMIVVTGSYGPRGLGGGPEAIHVDSLRLARV